MFLRQYIAHVDHTMGGTSFPQWICTVYNSGKEVCMCFKLQSTVLTVPISRYAPQMEQSALEVSILSPEV